MIVVISPPLPDDPRIVLLENGNTRSVWSPVCMLTYTRSYRPTDMVLVRRQEAWACDDRYLSEPYVQYLLTSNRVDGGNHGFATPPLPLIQVADTATATLAPLAVGDSRPVLGEIGKVECINVAPLGQPQQLRYFGRGKGCSGQAHATEKQAEADVRAWHAGKAVPYEQHAIVPLESMHFDVPLKPLTYLDEMPQQQESKLSKAEIIALFEKQPLQIFSHNSYVIGPNNTWPQAWEALLAGHRVCLPEWHPNYSWLLEGNKRELLLVEGATPAEWFRNPAVDAITGRMMLLTTWVVLPQVHVEAPTV